MYGPGGRLTQSGHRVNANVHAGPAVNARRIVFGRLGDLTYRGLPQPAECQDSASSNLNQRGIPTLFVAGWDHAFGGSASQPAVHQLSGTSVQKVIPRPEMKRHRDT